MRAARLYGVGDLRVEEVPEPSAPGPMEVLVAPLWCGLCGTDVKEYAGPGGTVPERPHPVTGATKPLILGHEFSARVVSVGLDVENARPGDHVAVMPLRYCGRCWFCIRGNFLLCPNKAWVGLSTQWGGLGDRALVLSYQVTPLHGLSDEQGAVVEPAAVSLNAVLRAGVRAGDKLLVVGAGPIGALAILAATAAGASTVLVSEPAPKRAALAAGLGATLLEGAAEGQLRQVDEMTEGRGVDAAIDCAGKEGTLTFCIHAVRPGGTVSVPAVHRSPTEADMRTLTRKPVSVVGSLGYTFDAWDRTIALIAAGKYPVERVVTARARRDAVVEDGFKALLDADRGELKVLIEVDGAGGG